MHVKFDSVVHLHSRDECLKLALEKRLGKAPPRRNPYTDWNEGFGFLCSFVMNLAVAVPKIVVGVTYIDECPTNGHVPVYLVVGGAIQLLLLLTLHCRGFRNKCFLIVLLVVGAVWMMIGTVDILLELEPDYFKEGWRYCNKTLYYFALFGAAMDYVFLFSFLYYVCNKYSFDA